MLAQLGHGRLTAGLELHLELLEAFHLFVRELERLAPP
jgi:hypothetical protein